LDDFSEPPLPHTAAPKGLPSVSSQEAAKSHDRRLIRRLEKALEGLFTGWHLKMH